MSEFRFLSGPYVEYADRISYLVMIWAGAAFIFGWVLQIFAGAMPCQLCIYQRYMYLACCIVGALAMKLPILRNVPLIMWFALGLLAAFQWEVENGLFPDYSCATPNAANTSFEQFTQSVNSESAMPPCDKPTHFFLDVSIATWSALYIWVLMGPLAFNLGRQWRRS